MLYDIAHFWIALVVAVALGVMVGWYTHSGEPRHGPLLRLGHGWIFWSVALFFVGLVLALGHVMPDRPGLWLETALLIFVAYLVGCPLPGLLITGSIGRTSGKIDRPGALLPRQTPAGHPEPFAADRLGDGRSPPTPAEPSASAHPAKMPPATDRVGDASAVGYPNESGSPSIKTASDVTHPSGGIISDDPDSVDKPKR